MTTREPGASEVLMCGFTRRPRSTAFFASRPAASMTAGLLVLVQEVMAAISTSPWPRSTPSRAVAKRSSSWPGSRPKPFSDTGAENRRSNAWRMAGRAMRSCGRLGPASEGWMVARSSTSVRV